jgi:hypothetical protein
MDNLAPIAPKVKHARTDRGQYGPAKGQPLRRWATRIAKLYRKMVREHRGGPIPLDYRALSRYLGCSYQTIQRRTGEMADGGNKTAWSYQAYGFVVFERHRAHEEAPCGVPQMYICNRYARHTIGGEPGRTRARLRQKDPAQWLAYLSRIKDLAFGILLRRKNRADDKHNGSPQQEQEVTAQARPPPPENRLAFRRWGGVAANLESEYAAIPRAPRVHLFGWLVNRLEEWHDRAAIVKALEHAVSVLPRGRREPPNVPAWISRVAWRHLDGDGLAVVQRRHAAREKGRKAGRSAPTLNDKRPERLSGSVVVDLYGEKWEHLGGTNYRKVES